MAQGVWPFSGAMPPLSAAPAAFGRRNGATGDSLTGVWGQTPDCGRFFLARWQAGVKNLNRAFS